MKYISSHATAEKNINKFICEKGGMIQLKYDQVLSHIEICFSIFLKTFFGIRYYFVSECVTVDKLLYFLQPIGKPLLHYIQILLWGIKWACEAILWLLEHKLFELLINKRHCFKLTENTVYHQLKSENG